MDDLKEKTDGWAGGVILDMATGRGGFIPYLQVMLPRYDYIIGIDISAAEIDNVRRLYGTNSEIKFAFIDGAALAAKTGSFDTVSITNSRHHLRDIEQTMTEMKRVLRLGGMFLIFEMFNDNQNEKQMSHVLAHHWWAEIDRLTGQLDNETFTKNQLNDIAEQIGLKKLNFVEPDDNEPVDELAKERIRATIDDYIDKLKNMPANKALLERGFQLLQRIDDIGFSWATSLCTIGYK